MRRPLVLIVLFWLALVGSYAYADTIAMLPLDGEKRLEIYGQPVATEIGRALKAAGLDVVVVSARMDVPDRANLIVDGTIKAVKNKQIELSIRVRDPRDGTVLDTLPAPPTKLDDLDKAAADLSARVVPLVKSRLEALAKRAVVIVDKPNTDGRPVLPTKPTAPAAPVLAVEVTADLAASPKLAPLRTELDREAALWAATQHYAAKVAFEVIDYKQFGKVPMARARVRVKISDATGDKRNPFKFNRVVRTDTVVGDPKSTPGELAARTAREVLAIVRPHLRPALGLGR